MRIEIGNETSALIDTYLEQMRKQVGNKNKNENGEIYLITKNNGDTYKDGKLSRYIIDMFKRYTKVKHLGINELRHSVATFYKNETEEFKAKLAYKMQHSLTQHMKYERFSNKVIKIPALHRTSSAAPTLKDPFVGKEIRLLIGRIIHKGVVHKSEGESTKEYTVVFEDETVNPRQYSSTDIAIRLESDDIVMFVGKRVRYHISANEVSLFGREGSIDAELEMNEEYFQDIEAPPYRLRFVNSDDAVILEKTFHMPHPKVEFI